MSNSVLVRFDAAAEGDDVGFAVCGQDVQPHSQVDDGGEDLGAADICFGGPARRNCAGNDC